MPGVLSLPLYHGTSTLFLASIIEHGLGGENPVAKWRVLNLAQRLHPLVKKHLAQEDDWMVGAQNFGWMCEQRSGNFNFQHGHAYLSPSILTGVRYAVGNRYGSELLSHTLEFLGELVRREIVDARGELSDQFSELFQLLRGAFAPLLIEVRSVSTEALLDEHGNPPQRALAKMDELLAGDPHMAHIMLQQTNFRFARAAPLSDLTFWLLDLQGGEQFMGGVARHLVYVPGAHNAGMSAGAGRTLPETGSDSSPRSQDSNPC